jgi:hypothetical protein
LSGAASVPPTELGIGVRAGGALIGAFAPEHDGRYCRHQGDRARVTSAAERRRYATGMA